MHPCLLSCLDRPSSDTGRDILGWKFKDTLLDDDNILWNTLQIESSKSNDTFVTKVSEVRTWIRRDKSANGPPATPDLPVPHILRENLPPELRHPIESATPFRAILLPPRSIPASQLRLPAKSSRDERRKLKAHRALSAKVRFSGHAGPLLFSGTVYLWLTNFRY
jgi:hypothetical protein